MSKKKGKKLINLLREEKLKNHPGRIDTIWLSPEETEILLKSGDNSIEWFKPGLELVGSKTVRITDGDVLAEVIPIFSHTTLDLLADKLSTRLGISTEDESI